MKSCRIFAKCAALLLLLFSGIGCAPLATQEKLDTSNDSSLPEVSRIFDELANYRVVLVGEQHNRLDHHVIQLEVIKYLHQTSPSVAIGLEFFQQPYQAALDRYISGEISEQQMLRESGYFSRWGYDFRLYAPILRYARQYGIPLVALNVPAEISRKTARSGLESLDEDESRYVPDEIERDVPGYEERILASFEMHSETVQANLAFFLEAQLLWDEGMASRAADYLRENPARQMIILAGAGHVAYKNGIPARLERRIHSPVASIVPADVRPDAEEGGADFHVRTAQLELPPKGLMGILLEADENGVLAQSVNPGSAAETAGVESRDYIRQINGLSIESFSDLQLGMWHRVPGETITLAVERVSEDEPQRLELTITLD